MSTHFEFFLNEIINCRSIKLLPSVTQAFFFSPGMEKIHLRSVLYSLPLPVFSFSSRKWRSNLALLLNDFVTCKWKSLWVNELGVSSLFYDVLFFLSFTSPIYRFLSIDYILSFRIILHHQPCTSLLGLHRPPKPDHWWA